jgi:hypothetical protein
MKRKISISVIAFSTFVLLIHAVVPHHHHGPMPCFAVEFCEEGNVSDDGDAHHNDETCVLESEYIASPLNRDVKPRVSYNREYGHDHIYLFPVYYLVASCVNCGAGDSFLTTEYGGYLIFYKSSEAVGVRGLRAPPSILS